MELFLIIIYGIAFIAIIYYMIQLKPNDSKLNKAVISAEPIEHNLWPWSITKYSFWSHWFDKSDGYGYSGHGAIDGHGSGYGYTGRQPATSNSFEGDHYGWDLDGGNYSGSGYGYTGR